MVAHAQAELPAECCGLLAGRVPAEGEPSDQVLVKIRYPLLNELQSATEYRSEPRSMFDAMRDMRNREIDILAVYHSHPSSRPVPSKKDLESNYSEGVINFILSLSGPSPELLGWWLSSKDYESAEWSLV
jgi:proteasome lid subunit RPN8/RPN11